jgi:hypothetical protein
MFVSCFIIFLPFFKPGSEDVRLNEKRFPSSVPPIRPVLPLAL